MSIASKSRTQDLQVRDCSRGMILPLVLFTGFLLAAMVLAYKVVTSSGERKVARFVRSLQSELLADLASDELYLTVGAIPTAPEDEVPEWVDTLKAELEEARVDALAAGVAIETLPVRHEVDVTEELVVTRQAATATEGLVVVPEALWMLGPFEVLSSRYDDADFYAEPAFEDGDRDRRPWDLRAQGTLRVSVEGAGGPFRFRDVQQRGQVLQVTDTVPPASRFALFSYLPPPSEDHALNDLQRGGRFTVVPGDRGRVMVRGPLLLLAEAARAETPHLGGERPPPSPAYPDTYWTNWARIPGPRAVHHPQSGGLGMFGGLLARVSRLVPGVQSGMETRRPVSESSRSTFETAAFSFEVDVGPLELEIDVEAQGPLDLGGVSLVAASGMGSAHPGYQTVDRDVVAYYPGSAYLHGAVEPGQQLWSLAIPPLRLFSGVLVSAAEGAVPRPFRLGLEPPREGDAILLEPLPAAGSGDGGDWGVLGLYGVATLVSKTYASLSILDVFEWVVKQEIEKLSSLEKEIAEEIGVEKIARSAIESLGLSRDLQLLFRRFEALPGLHWDRPPADLDLLQVSRWLDEEEALVAPHGYYWHEEAFWNMARIPSGLKETLVESLRTPVLSWPPERVLDTFFQDGAGDTWKRAEREVSASSADASREMRQWLCGEHASFLRRRGEDIAGATQSDALRQILREGVDEEWSGLPPLLPSSARAGPGAFGPEGPPGEGASTGTGPSSPSPPAGLFPPGYRQWETLATRTYPDLPSYLAAESHEGVLRLDGVVLIRDLSYPGPAGPSGDVVYRGRGVIVVVTDREGQTPILNGRVLPAPDSPGSELILAHRVSRERALSGEAPPLRLGPLFVGSVYSDTGIAPAGSRTRIEGNLVTGLLVKKNVPPTFEPGEGVFVVHRGDLEAAADGPRAPFWTLQWIK